MIWCSNCAEEEGPVIKTLLDQSRDIADWLVAFRRDLHQYPELSFQEERTAGKVLAELKHLDLNIRTKVGGHGIVADLVGSRPGPTIALRADMDALPIQEATGLPFASENAGVMHACGHDAHTAMLLGAAYLLAGMRERLKGNVRFLFQSAEEINAGAKAMIREGALQGVNEIYGLHNLPTLAAGRMTIRAGAMMGSVDRIDITLEGKGGHGAMPDRSIDPIVAASALVMGLQTAVSREISPFEPAVVTIGSIHAGEANNVIPQVAKLTGTVRTFSAETQSRMPAIIERIANEIGSAYRCKVELVYTQQTPVLENDADCAAYAAATADRLIGREHWAEAAPTMAGEDFSVYLREIPGCFVWLGSGPAEGAENAYGLHHPKFCLNEDCIPLGAAYLAALAAGKLDEACAPGTAD